MRRSLLLILAVVTAAVVPAAAPAAASTSVPLDGSFFTTTVKPDFVNSWLCLSGVTDECGTIQLTGLGAADWAYVFGPTFAPDGRCFDVDGTFSLTLHSDASAISGPLTGLLCPRPSSTGHRHGGAVSFGNPFVEDDTITLTNGTGQYAGLSGTAYFHTFSAGAVFDGSLTGTLAW